MTSPIGISAHTRPQVEHAHTLSGQVRVDDDEDVRPHQQHLRHIDRTIIVGITVGIAVSVKQFSDLIGYFIFFLFSFVFIDDRPPHLHRGVWDISSTRDRLVSGLSLSFMAFILPPMLHLKIFWKRLDWVCNPHIICRVVM